MPGFVDLQGNSLQLPDSEGSFVGHDPVDESAFPLQIYNFVDASIREMDAAEGNFFLRRFLAGPQIVWQILSAGIKDIRKTWSIVDCPDELLHVLKLSLGWTKDLDYLTEQLDAKSLRRLLLISIDLWRSRATEHSLTAVVVALFGVRARIWNWFDLRWILDDNILSEEHQGRDPVLLSLPGPPDMDEMKSCVRIMDDLSGNVDRSLCVEFLKLFRNNGERLTVVWLRFLDMFKDDLSRWTSTDDGASIADESIVLVDDSKDEYAIVHGFAALDTHDHLGFVRIKGGSAASFGAVFWRQENGDSYLLSLDVAANALRLEKIVSGVVTALATYSFLTDFEILVADAWYGLRWTASVVGPNTEIEVYVNGDPRLSFTAPNLYESGTFGVYHETGTTVACSEIEIMPLPAETTSIEINS